MSSCASRACRYAGQAVQGVVDALFGVVGDSLEGCSTPMSATQFLDIVGSRNLEITSVNFSQYVTVTGECLRAPATQHAIQQGMEGTAARVADELAAETQASAADAAAMRDVVQKMAVDIQTLLDQDCTTQVNLIQGVRIENATGGGYLRFVRYSQVADVVRSCLLERPEIERSKAALAAIVERTPRARTAGLAEMAVQLVVVALVVIAAIGLVTWRGTRVLAEPLFWLGLVLPLLVMLIVDYVLGWPPYRGPSPTEADRQWNRTVLLVVIALTLLDVGAIAAVLFVRARRARTAAITNHGSAAPTPVPRSNDLPPTL